MKFRLDPLSPHGISLVDPVVITGGGSSSSGSSHDAVTLAGEDYLSLSGQQITANAIDLDNLSATGTPDASTFLRGDNTWATPAGSGDMTAAVYDPQNIADDAFARANHTGTQTASTISDFDTEVSNNTDVAANTAARHAAVTVADSAEIDLTLTGQQISASLVAGSIDETKLDLSVNASLDLADSAVQDLSDLGITATATELNYTDGVTSAIQTQLDAKAADADVVHDTGNETIAGTKTFSSDPIIPDEAYGVGWNGSLEPPTKNAVYDKIETMGGGGSGDVVGPASSTDNAIARFDDTTGKLIQDSLATIDDLGNISLPGSATVDGRDVSVDGTKLDGIEAGADVTDTANVTAAGALMDSEVDADIKTLSLPASTTITAAAATVLDDTTVANMVNTLGGASSTGTGGLVRATSPALTTPTGIVKGDVGLGNVDNTSDATKQAATLLAAWPVNSIYTSIVSTNPSSLFGGTWSAFGAGRVLVGLDSGDTDFDTAEETGGAKTVTLTAAQSGLPSHAHTIVAGGNTFDNANTAGRVGGASTQTNATKSGIVNAIAGADAASAHNNVQPYIVVYFFKRTA